MPPTAPAARTPHQLPADVGLPGGEFFRTFVDTLPALLWAATADGQVEYLSQGWERYTGLTIAELAAGGWGDAIYPDDRAHVWNEWTQTIARGGEYQVEFRYRRHDGAFEWHRALAAPVRDADGRIARWAGVTTNIHATRQAREQARTSSDLLRVVWESAADGMRLTDRDGIVRMANPAYCRMVGRSSGEIVGHSLSVAYSPHDGEHILRRYRERFATRDHRTRFVSEVQLWNGRQLWLEVSSAFLDLPGQEVLHFGVFRDVTERRRTEAELHRTASLLQAVADGTTDAVFVKDRDGRYLFSNAAAARFLSRTVEDVLGQDDAALFGSDSARRLRAQDREVMDTGQAMSVDNRLTAAGVTRVYQATKAPYRDEQGNMIGLVGISRDVTEWRGLAAERDALLSQLQIQIERMPLAYLLTGPDLRYVRWNPAAERTFGFAEAEVLGKHPFEVVVPLASRALVRAVFDRLLAGDMGAHGACENVTKDGRLITCQWHNTPLFDPDGRFLGVLSLAEDISDRVRLEEQFRQAQKMEALGQLAGGVAHDFNNLLTVINGYSDLLLDDLDPSDPGFGLVAEIRKAGERSAGLTRQLLAFGRREVVAPRILDPNAVVRDIEAMLRRVLGEDVRLSIRLDPDLLAIRADQGQLEQVLMNLAVNARDAMPSGGTLSVATANVRFDPKQAAIPAGLKPGPYVVLTVADTGCGLTEEVKRRLFEPFFTTKGKGKGTGLGLAVVHGLVTQAGGSIAVEGEPGRGAAFHVYLPAADEAPARTKSPHGFPSAPRGTETVLLAEDEDGVRALNRHVLGAAGYTVLEAADGAEAVRLAGTYRGPIHLLVTDVVMPGMGGREAAELLRADNPDLRVLYVSGYTDDAVVRYGVERDDVEFLQKPFSPVALAHKVRQVLDRRRPDGVGASDTDATSEVRGKT